MGLLKRGRDAPRRLADGLDEMCDGDAQILVVVKLRSRLAGTLARSLGRHIEHVADVHQIILLHTAPPRWRGSDPADAG